MCGLIIRVRVVPRRTVVGDIDRRFDNLSGSHHQSHVNCVSSVYGIYISGQLSRDVIGCFKSNRWFVYLHFYFIYLILEKCSVVLRFVKLFLTLGKLSGVKKKMFSHNHQTSYHTRQKISSMLLFPLNAMLTLVMC